MSSSITHGRRTVSARRERSGRRRAWPGSAVLVAVALGLLVRPSAGATQQEADGQERCDLMESERVRSVLTGEGGRITYVSGPALFVCEDETRIRADSAVEYTSTRFRELIGEVEIDGPESRVRADRVHLSSESGRTQAWGGVRVLEKGSAMRMVGDTLVLLRTREFRDREELRMWGAGPYAVLRLGGERAPESGPGGREGSDSAGVGPEVPAADAAPDAGPPSPPPDTVFGDRLYMQGRSRFLAGGSVRIRRSALEAFGDSLDYDREGSRALLLGRDSALARIEGDEYDLVGRELDLRVRGARVSEVEATHRARVTGEDVRIDAPRIRVFLSGGGEIDRLVAIRAPSAGEDEAGDDAPDAERPVARAEDVVLRADSIDVEVPGQRPERVYAVGGARAETLGRDSLNTPETPELIRRDWIEGDTVVAHFRPADPRTDGEEQDTTEGDGARDRLDRLVARGNARSLYRLTRGDSGTAPPPEAPSRDSVSASGVPDSAAAPSGDPPVAVERSEADPAGAGADGGPGRSGSAPPRPAVHYVVGDRITIVLSEGEVEHMEVVGRTRGLYLEPQGTPPEPAAPPDSAVSPPANSVPSGGPTGGEQP